jgi:hypothetical protein
MIEIDEDTERVLIFQWPRFSIRTLFYQDSVIRYLSYFQFSKYTWFLRGNGPSLQLALS